MTGADAIVDALVAAEVEVVFGLPGVHNLPLWEALRASERIRLITVRHEQTAGYAADGYARATGKVGVALVTTGPGAANCVTAIGEANASRSPVVVVATDVPTALRKPGVVRGVLHETSNQAALFAPVTRAQLVARAGDELGSLLTAAVDGAVEAPSGPAYLGIPTDLLAAPNGEQRTSPARAAVALRGEEAAALARAAELVAASRRPLVWAGGGAVDAGTEVGAFAARLGAPLLTTFAAAGLHPDAIFPPHDPAVGALWDQADLVVGVGTDFDGTDTQNWNQPRPPKLVQVGVDWTDASKNWEPDVFVLRDAAEITAIAVEPRAPWFERPEPAVGDPQARQLLAALDEAVPPDAVVVCDMCIPGYWVGGYRRFARPRSLQYPIGWGTLGFGLPAAIGAAASGRSTLAIVGDGGFLFACGDLATVEQERMPLTIVLFDDGGYGMLRHDGADPFRLHTPDFVALAQSFGLHAEKVTLTDLGRRLDDHLTGHAPSMVVVDAALTPPPTTSPQWYRVRR